MLYYHPTSKAYVRDGEGFTHNGNQYPASWDKQSLGFVEVATVGTREDDRYFWVSEEVLDGVRTYVNTPRDPGMLRKRDAQAEILRLEAQVTPRRLREAALGGTAFILGITEAIAIQVAILKE